MILGGRWYELGSSVGLNTEMEIYLMTGYSMAHTESRPGHNLHFEPVEDEFGVGTFCSCGWARAHLGGPTPFIDGRFLWATHVATTIHRDEVTGEIMTALEGVATTDPVTGTKSLDLASIEGIIREHLA